MNFTNAQTKTDYNPLFFSEYVEGSGNNKAIEIFNNSEIMVNLDSGNYVLQYYLNGNSDPGTTIILTGEIAPYSVMVIAHKSAEFLIVNGGTTFANLTSSSSWYNGNDAVVLRKGGPSGKMIDVIGQIGLNPEKEWGSGLASTAGNTLRRNKTICSGDTTGSDLFEVTSEWEGFPENSFERLGEHINNCIEIPDEVIPVYSIQGIGDESPYKGKFLTTEGVVTAAFQDKGMLNGFYIQDTLGDNNDLSSDGIFVYNTSFRVSIGNYVKLSGLVEEFYGLTEIKSVANLEKINTTMVHPVEINLPLDSLSTYERYEGMLVTFPQKLTVNDVSNLELYGEVSLSSMGRIYIPTNKNKPEKDSAISQRELNAKSRIILDDGSLAQYPEKLFVLDPENNSLRVGSTIQHMTGIMDYSFDQYKIQPVDSLILQYAERPDAPVFDNCNLTIASFNVMNYFNGDGMGGGFPTPRGASTFEEFIRQNEKIVMAIMHMDADVVGLIEMENDGYGEESSIAYLTQHINEAYGRTVYDYIRDPAGPDVQTGADEIRQAIIYKPSTVLPISNAITYLNDYFIRPPVSQTFISQESKEIFSIVINHFKSKGCTDASGYDADQNDGQACYNNYRKLQAASLLDFVNIVQQISGDSDVAVIGDFNAYKEEEPVHILREGGLVEAPNLDYSYNFKGESGLLDYAFTTKSLSVKVRHAMVWHINADEPLFHDYRIRSDSVNFYKNNPYRSSDHDPVLLGFHFEKMTNVQSKSYFNNSDSYFSFFYNNDIGLAEIISQHDAVVTIRLIDALSKNVITIDRFVKKGENKIDFPTRNLSPGIYVAKVSFGGNLYTEKLFIGN